MKNLNFLVLLILITSCQKPDLAGPVTIGGRTNCVGGGCSDAAAFEQKYQITSDGYVSYTKEELKGPPEDPKSPSTGLWGGFWKNVGNFWSPTTNNNPPPTSIPLPNPEAPTEDGSTIVDGGEGTSTTTGTGTPGETSEGNTTPPRNGGKGLRGSELDKLANNVGRHLSAGWGEITGKNRKKRREAREKKAKYNEAMALKGQVEGMVTEMDEGSRIIEGVVQDVLDPSKFTPTGDLKGVTYNLATEHNNAVDSMINDTKDIDVEVDVPAEQPRYDTPELRAVERARQYQTYVQNKINAMPAGERGQRQVVVDFASNGLSVAEASYKSGDTAKGDMAKELSLVALDLALSLTPGVGLGKDIYEFSRGVSLVGGKKLTTFEWTMAGVGILTAGYGSKLALVGKAGVLIDIFKTGNKEAEAVAAATKVVTRAEEIAVAAEKAGAKSKSVIESVSDGIKEGLPCNVAMHTPFQKLWNFIEPKAWAVDCLPGDMEGKLVETLNSLAEKGARAIPKMTSAQTARVSRIENAIADHAKPHDFEGVFKELKGEVIIGSDGKAFNHVLEMKETKAGLEKSSDALKDSLKNPNLDKEVREYLEYQVKRADDTIKKMTDALNGKVVQ